MWKSVVVNFETNIIIRICENPSRFVNSGLPSLLPVKITHGSATIELTQ